MYFVPEDIKERNTFVDKSIEAAQTAFAHPSLVKFQGPSVVSECRKLLREVVVANYGDRGIELPKGIPASTDKLVVVAISRGETPQMASSLNTQTDSQKHATIKAFRKWGAKPSAKDYYDAKRLGDVDFDGDPISYPVPSLTRAMTGSFAHFMCMDQPEGYGLLPNAPTASIIQVNMRPTVMLMMGEESHAPGEVLAHELAHVRQILRDPVRAYTSQKTIDMTNLRDELEAYHLGADISYIENGSRPVELILPEGGADLQKRLQSVVESLRRAHGVDPLDPYRPSPSLLKLMHGLGDIIMHQRLNFEDLKALFE